jgi:hypothetical protein
MQNSKFYIELMKLAKQKQTKALRNVEALETF